MMPQGMNNLFTRLSIAFLLVLLSLGLVSIWIFHRSGNNYNLEFLQKENSQIARYMTEQAQLTENGQLNSDALDELSAHILMINPGIEVYLLDQRGTILEGGSFQPEQALDEIELAPIQRFIADSAVYPILGGDPRDAKVKRVFSAHPIYAENSIAPNRSASASQQALGYLYIVLGNSNQKSVLDALYSSKSFRNSLLALLVALGIALLFGTSLMFALTRKLRSVVSLAKGYHLRLANQAAATQTSLPLSSANNHGDFEILENTYKRMAQRLSEQCKELKKSDQNRREFVAAISHDLRTPLTCQQNYIETLLVKWDNFDENKKVDFLTKAHRQGDRLEHLISQLFEISKLNSPDTKLNKENFSLLEFAYDCSQDLTLICEEKNLQIGVEKFTHKPAKTNVYADIAMIQRVFENLLTNAIRHTEANGKVTIFVEHENQDKVRIRVHNEGSELSKEQITKLNSQKAIGPGLESQRDGGSGLGLQIVHRILNLHDSKLEIKSSRQYGTEFSFVLESHVPCQEITAFEPLSTEPIGGNSLLPAMDSGLVPLHSSADSPR